MPDATGSIRLNIVDGTRNPISSTTTVLLRVLDGRKRQIATQWVTGPTILLSGLPFRNSPDDWYTIISHADGYEDAGLYPVRLRGGHSIDAYAMLLPRDGVFHFSSIASVQADPQLYQLIANGAPSDAADRYHSTLESNGNQLGALLTIGTAIRDIPLDDLSSPLNYYWEVIWDLLMPDRFWAWVEVGLVNRIAKLAALHSFAEEKDPATFHRGIPGRVQPATRSWKQTRFDVTNVQLTFHEGNTRTIKRPDGTMVDCVVVEPDIDYYKDLLAHGLLEVAPNLIAGGKTDPRQDYALRWMATKLEGIQPDFAPPVTIE